MTIAFFQIIHHFFKSIHFLLKFIILVFLLSNFSSLNAAPDQQPNNANAFSGNQGKGVGNVAPGNQGAGNSSSGRAGTPSEGGGNTGGSETGGPGGVGTVGGSGSVGPASGGVNTGEINPRGEGNVGSEDNQVNVRGSTSDLPKEVGGLIEGELLVLPPAADQSKEEKKKTFSI